MDNPSMIARRTLQRFEAWYEGSLVNRVALKAQLLLVGMLLLIAVASYVTVREMVVHSLQERLSAFAALNSQRLESALDRVISGTEGLSQRSLVVNGLVDSAGSQSYLRPFLREYAQSFPELAELSMFDALGNIVASSSDHPQAPRALLGKVLRSERGDHALEVDAGRTRLYLAFPIAYPGTRMTEGALALEMDLRLLAERSLRVDQFGEDLPMAISLRRSGGREVYRGGRALAGRLIEFTVPLAGKSAELGIGLEMTVSVLERDAFLPMVKVSLAMLPVGLLMLWLTYVLSRRMSETIVGPLADMSHRAMEIAGAGPLGLRPLEVTRSDEVGWMGTAFNEMVYSLRLAYDTQEEQVQARTEELAEARERLAGVLAGMDDVVYAASPDFSAIEYVSPASLTLFGLIPEELYVAPHIFVRLVHPEDAAMVEQVRRELLVNQDMELRYRIVRPDGGIRWILDRSHLVVDIAGQVQRVGGILRDVTDAVEAEASLHLRERALASSSCGVVISDMLQPGQPILYANAAFERITGYAPQEVIGRNCSFLQGDERDQAAVAEIRSAVADGRECKVILRNFRKDGEPFWNELMLSPLRDSSGRVTHFIGIQNDITGTMAATQALVASERRLALTIDALDEGVWDWSIADNRLYTSPSWAHVLGLDPATVKQDFSAFVSQLSGDWLGKVLTELQAYIDGSDELFYLEHQMDRADGTKIWVANQGRVVERDEKGQPLRMVGTIVDITQRYQASEQIIELMRQLDAIFTLSPDAFGYFDGSGKLSFVNPAFERMTGIRAGEVSGLSLPVFSDRLRALADPCQLFPDLASTDQMLQGDGQLIYLQKPQHRVLLVCRRGGAEGESAVVYLRDVTRETEVDRMKSEFLSTAAHELRTPMASIMGFSELLLMREFDAGRVKDMLGTINRQAKRLTDLINELLDLARIEARAGKDFKIQRQSLLPVVRDAVAALTVDGDRSRMVVELPEALDEVEIDPAKFQQAVINVISNAYKYSPQGGAINISVCTRSVAEGMREVGVAVRDHGVGMTPEQLARVFERFFRADPSGNIPGTGLGMSLVKEIMDRHNGTVQMESEPGAGTVVILWLPVAGMPAAPGEPQEPAAGVQATGPALTLWLDDTLSNDHAELV